MEESRLGTVMTDFGIDFRSSDDFGHLGDRVAAARAQTRTNAERYVQLRRTVDATREEARDLRGHAAMLRETLRESVMAYATALRRTSVPPERAVVLVKSAVLESDSYPDKHNRHVVEEAVRWAVDAYYAT
jgi:hypothetical protein